MPSEESDAIPVPLEECEIFLFHSEEYDPIVVPSDVIKIVLEALIWIELLYLQTQEKVL